MADAYAADLTGARNSDTSECRCAGLRRTQPTAHNRPGTTS
jgi:hypothetical protein